MAVMVQDLFRMRGGASPASHAGSETACMWPWRCRLFFAIVLLDAMLRPLAGFDLPLITRIQAIDFPGLERYLALVSDLTGSVGAIALWALATVAFATRRIWSAALAMVLMPIGGVINTLIGELLVERTRPHMAELERTSLNFEERSFPSGHVEGAILFYGLIFLLARRIENRAIRLAVQTGRWRSSPRASFARIWQGAHWPSDVIGALLLGGVLAIALDEIARRTRSLDGLAADPGAVARSQRDRRPCACADQPGALPGHVGGQGLRSGTAPRALYWVAFQAPFPYIANVHALWAAAYRRNLAGMLTEYWYGQRLTAGVLGVDRDRRPAGAGQRVCRGTTQKIRDGGQSVPDRSSRPLRGSRFPDLADRSAPAAGGRQCVAGR